MRQFNLIALGLAFTLVGCQLPLNLPAAVTPTTGTNGTPTGAAPSDDQVPRMGTLRFTVLWPERDLPGFSAQVIPLSTEYLVFKLEDADGNEVANERLSRTAGQTLATTTLHLPEGGGYKATVMAYDSNNVRIAKGNAANVTVVWGKTTPVTITLDAEFAPHIERLEVGHGAPGQTLVIEGENLARGHGWPLVIFPSGVEVAGTTEGETITVTIPQNAGSGTLKVKVDGVTSTTNALFQEVMSLELTADGNALGDMRDGDGAIASWLGDSFAVRVTGKDTAHVLVPNPAITGWTFSDNGVGTVDHNGTFLAEALGRSTVTAHLGSVSGSRDVIVAPPAGPIIRVAEDKRGIADVHLTKVGDRYLAAWHVPADQRIYWQMRKADGSPDGEIYNSPAAWDGFERAVRVSAAPDADGHIKEILLAYRLTVPSSDNPAVGRNGVVFRALDPVTGAPKQENAQAESSTRLHSDRLLDVASNESGHLIGVLRFDGTKYSHRFIRVTFDAAGTPTFATGNYPNDTLVPYSYRDDTLSIKGVGDRFLIARHYGTGGGSGPTGLGVELMDWNFATIHSSNLLHEQNRVAAVATNDDGTRTIVAAMEISAGGTKLKIYPYNETLTALNLGVTVAELNIAGSDPLNWPLDIEWSPGETPEDGRFILTYGRKVGTYENDQIVYYNQAMVQAIKPDGTLDGPSFPLAKDSAMPTFVPSAEGGMALWVDPSRAMIMRRVRYRNLP